MIIRLRFNGPHLIFYKNIIIIERRMRKKYQMWAIRYWSNGYKTGKGWKEKLKKKGERNESLITPHHTIVISHCWEKEYNLQNSSHRKPIEALHRLLFRLLPPISLAERCLLTASTTTTTLSPAPISVFKAVNSPFNGNLTITSKSFSLASTRRVAKAGWFLGLGDHKKLSLPDVVKAGDPVLHEPAQEVNPDEISSERIQKIIDDMIKVMRKAPGVGLAAPQIGIPLRIIVLEYTTEYISYAPKEEIKAQERRPFDLLVILNPKLEKRSDRTALFFEGCLSVDGFRAAVERYLDVEVTGLDRNGELIKINASGWQARILQHECDHLDGILYVDKMIPRTFRTVENFNLPLAPGCPKLGFR